MTADTPETLLSHALAGTAPHTAAAVSAALEPEVVAQLVHAIDRRVYMAVRSHDEKIALAITEHMQHAREVLRLRVVGATTDLPQWVDGQGLS